MRQRKSGLVLFFSSRRRHTRYWRDWSSDGALPISDTRVGMTFGHEFIGVVEEVGSSVQNLKRGDRVMVPFNVFCGSCFFCARGLYANCHNVNPNATAVGGIYGYSHTCGGYDGGQAEFVRVPLADVGPSLIPDWMDDEDAVLCTDALATGYFGAQLGDIVEGDVVVVFGAGPVGLYAAKSAWFMGAGRVIVIDHLEYRLDKARSFAHAETYNFAEYDDIVVHMKKITGHLGADVAIDAVGAEADGNFTQMVTATKLKLQRSEEHTSELQSRQYLVCRLLLEKKKDFSSPDIRV